MPTVTSSLNCCRYLANFFGRLFVLGTILVLASCSNNTEMIELQNYVQQTVNRPPGQIEPLPEFISYEAFTYSAASLRGPFDVPVDVTTALRNQRNNQVQPDPNRPREFLENFAIGSLTMVGTLARNEVTWGLIRDETGSIHRVMGGNYLGRNHGRIIAISETQIDLVEIVPTGDGGWIERPQTITLQD